MNEIWKNIEGYDGLYQVSDRGQVRSFSRNGTKGKILKPQKNNKGYLSVMFYKDGEKKWFLVHRLVANAFIPNPRNYPVINHVDENPLNNVVSNLEWCSVRYNTCYGTGLERGHAKLVNGPLAKQVLQFDKRGNLLKTWPSIQEVKRQLGFNDSAICQCCKGKRQSANGYVWRFKI